jgi:hypothetical protein
MLNLGKITSGISFVGETISDTAGGIYGGAKEAFSDRAPTPKQIGGPIADLGLGVVSSGLGLGQKIKTTTGETFESFQESAAKTIVGGLDPVFGEGAPLDISAPARAGDYGGAIGQLGTQVSRPIVQTGQALTLPLLAVAGILLLK